MRGKKLIKDRQQIKLMLKLWLAWTITMAVLSGVFVSQFDRLCDEKTCECGRSIVTWIIIYSSIMMGYTCCMFRNYVILFTLFGSRRKSKGFHRQIALVFNPLLLFTIAIGIQVSLKAEKRASETVGICELSKFVKLWRHIKYLILGGLLANGVYLLVVFLTNAILLIRKNCREVQNQLSSDE